MVNRLKRLFTSLDLEEKILNGGSIITIIGVCLPWISGEWLGGERMSSSGLTFYTSFLGLAILLIHLFILALTVVPVVGGPPLVRRKIKEVLRFLLSLHALVLVLASLSVLTKVTFEFSRMEVRFGIYVTLVGCLITLLYAFLRYQEFKRQEPQEVFHHPDHPITPPEPVESVIPPPPPPPPPPPLEPEEHTNIRP